MRIYTAFAALAISFLITASHCAAAERIVSNTSQFSSALAAAAPGDVIILQPGIYGGGHYRAGMNNVVIRSADPNNRAIFDGSNTAIQLSDANQVTIADLVFRNQASNSLNIDDGGTFDTPTSNIVLRNLLVQDIQNPGNLDGIKLSGVNNFLIDRVQVRNWGTGGSAVDMVGCHHGLIQNSLFVHTNTSNGGTTIQPKGGTKDITIRANRIELPRGAGRTIQAGGSTGAQFFRFVDGDSGYEAKQITAEGNVVVGGESAMSWVNIDGGIFHHNFVHRPGNWTMRILNENQGNAIVDTQNGKFHDNIVVFNDTASEYNSAVNIGPETLPGTFTFARNQWYNLANPSPAGSTPTLPTPETGGQYGVAPQADINQPIVWQFPWGRWIVNATANAAQVQVPDSANFRQALPAASATFKPLEANPLVGEWQYQQLSNAVLDLPAFSQTILVTTALMGDFDSDGDVDGADFVIWQTNFPAAGGQALTGGDADNDGDVDGADFARWQVNFPFSSNMVSVPEPGSFGIALLSLAAAVQAVRRRRLKGVS